MPKGTKPSREPELFLRKGGSSEVERVRPNTLAESPKECLRCLREGVSEVLREVSVIDGAFSIALKDVEGLSSFSDLSGVTLSGALLAS